MLEVGKAGRLPLPLPPLLLVVVEGRGEVEHLTSRWRGKSDDFYSPTSDETAQAGATTTTTTTSTSLRPFVGRAGVRKNAAP